MAASCASKSRCRQHIRVFSYICTPFETNGSMFSAFRSSPAGHVSSLTSPLLLIHGDSDAEVAFQVRLIKQGSLNRELSFRRLLA